jgi:hypothetical protein
MMNNNQGSNPNPTPQGGQNTPYTDWREQRREWRQQMREARRRDPWHGLFFGLLLVLMGGLFLSTQQGWIAGDIWWKYFLIGMGGLFILDGLVHYTNPDFRYSVFGKFVAGGILVLIGLFFIFNYTNWWPIVLIAAGCALLLRVVFRRA